MDHHDHGLAALLLTAGHTDTPVHDARFVLRRQNRPLAPPAVRLGLASWARRLLGMAGTTIADADEAHTVLSRLATMCAGLVDEVRRTMAAEDPDSTAGVDWPALMAEEVSVRWPGFVYLGS